MKRFIIIDPVFIEVFNPLELKSTPLVQKTTGANFRDQGETILAPGITLLTVFSNFFRKEENTKFIKQ